MRRLCILLLAAGLACGVAFLPRPVLFDGGESYTVYRYSASSLAVGERQTGAYIVRASEVKGESVSFTDDDFDVTALLERYGAVLLFCETVGEVTCYYAFAKTIPYRASLYGKTVNLHIAIDHDLITLGAPLIFGGF